MRALLLLSLIGTGTATGCRQAAGGVDDRPTAAVTWVDLDPRAEGLLVWFEETVPDQARLRVARDAGALVLHRYANLPALFVRGDADAFRTVTGVRSVSRVAPFHGAGTQVVALGSGAEVALVGPGVSPRARLRAAPRCFTTMPLGCDDPTGRGTAAAREVLAARPDAVILPVRVLDEDVGSDATVLAGLDWLAGLEEPVAEVRLPATGSKVVKTALDWLATATRPRTAAR